MRIYLLAVGRRVPAWAQAGFTEYARRLSGAVRLDLITVASGYRGKGDTPAKARQTEGQRLLDAIPSGCLPVALDESGSHWSTARLAKNLSNWMRSGDDLALLVGGADGLSKPCLDHAKQCWALGPLVYPHALVRVIVAEQLYRAWTMVNGHPYHRA